MRSSLASSFLEILSILERDDTGATIRAWSLGWLEKRHYLIILDKILTLDDP